MNLHAIDSYNIREHWTRNKPTIPFVGRAIFNLIQGRAVLQNEKAQHLAVPDPPKQGPSLFHGQLSDLVLEIPLN